MLTLKANKRGIGLSRKVFYIIKRGIVYVMFPLLFLAAFTHEQWTFIAYGILCIILPFIFLLAYGFAFTNADFKDEIALSDAFIVVKDRTGGQIEIDLTNLRSFEFIYKGYQGERTSDSGKSDYYDGAENYFTIAYSNEILPIEILLRSKRELDLLQEMLTTYKESGYRIFFELSKGLATG
ncbi:MAG TPA: hypothetical protein VK174_04625 [Chitinophagales bacterium]|nr:hypothetical protein [Chitinophagales bacterium]